MLKSIKQSYSVWTMKKISLLWKCFKTRRVLLQDGVKCDKLKRLNTESDLDHAHAIRKCIANHSIETNLMGWCIIAQWEDQIVVNQLQHMYVLLRTFFTPLPVIHPFPRACVLNEARRQVKGWSKCLRSWYHTGNLHRALERNIIRIEHKGCLPQVQSKKEGTV